MLVDFSTAEIKVLFVAGNYSGILV